VATLVRRQSRFLEHVLGFENPREVFRLELELPELGYQRTTLLDREALDALLEADDVRARVRDLSG